MLGRPPVRRAWNWRSGDPTLGTLANSRLRPNWDPPRESMSMKSSRCAPEYAKDIKLNPELNHHRSSVLDQEQLGGGTPLASAAATPKSAG